MLLELTFNVLLRNVLDATQTTFPLLGLLLEPKNIKRQAAFSDQTVSLSRVSVLASFIRIAKKKVAGVLCLDARIMIHTRDAVAASNMILTKARDWYNVNISDCKRKCIYLSTQS